MSQSRSVRRQETNREREGEKGQGTHFKFPSLRPCKYIILRGFQSKISRVYLLK